MRVIVFFLLFTCTNVLFANTAIDKKIYKSICCAFKVVVFRHFGKIFI